MRIPVGRIIRTDMGMQKWGMVLYLVINPPIICQNCNEVVFEWRSNWEKVFCPCCDNEIKHRDYLPCPVCGEMDYHSLRVVHNNNFHYDSVSGQVTQYCDKRGKVINMCGKSIMKQIKNQSIILLTAKESQDVKRKIVWTGSDDYDPIKPMPQQIINQFPYDEQE